MVNASEFMFKPWPGSLCCILEQLLFTFIELLSSFLMQQLEADNGYPKDFEVISAKVKDKKYTSVVSACWKIGFIWKTTVELCLKFHLWWTRRENHGITCQQRAVLQCLESLLLQRKSFVEVSSKCVKTLNWQSSAVEKHQMDKNDNPNCYFMQKF